MVNYADALDKLKRRFLIVGLTGYTGSGCSTARRILMKANKPELPGENVSLKITDKRRYEKLKRIWISLPWERFINIEVSRVIFLFVIDKAIKADIDNIAFSKAKEIAANAKEDLGGIASLLDVSQDVRTPEIASKVVNAYETFRKLYMPWKKLCKFRSRISVFFLLRDSLILHDRGRFSKLI